MVVRARSSVRNGFPLHPASKASIIRLVEGPCHRAPFICPRKVPTETVEISHSMPFTRSTARFRGHFLIVRLMVINLQPRPYLRPPTSRPRHQKSYCPFVLNQTALVSGLLLRICSFIGHSNHRPLGHREAPQLSCRTRRPITSFSLPSNDTSHLHFAIQLALNLLDSHPSLIITFITPNFTEPKFTAEFGLQP